MTLPLLFFFFNDTATTEIYTLSLHDALPIYLPPWPTPRNAYDARPRSRCSCCSARTTATSRPRSEEHTSELQSLRHLVCRLLLEKKTRINVTGPLHFNNSTDS